MKNFARAARFAGWLAALVPAVAAVVVGAASCTVVHGSGTGGGSAAGAGGEGGGGTGGGAHGITGRDVFDALQADLMKECGACHQLGGSADAAFLAAPDVYVSLTSWPGVVVPNAPQSILLTHPALSSHGNGQAPDLSAGLRTRVSAWLTREAMDLPSPNALDGGIKTYIAPIKPFLEGAFNTIYLDPISADLKNSSISFNAVELGDPPSLLVLTNLEVHPIAEISLHIVHPLLTVYPPSKPGDPDPVDSFSGLDATFSLASDSTLGTGTVVLTNWVKDARLGLAFEKVEAQMTSGAVATCKNVAKFAAEVVPQLQYCADNCHGGKKIEAKAAMDLSNLAAMPPDEACSQVRARIKPGDPSTSEILIVTNPKEQAVHLYKFAGNFNKYTAFANAVSPWITAEQ